MIFIIKPVSSEMPMEIGYLFIIFSLSPQICPKKPLIPFWSFSYHLDRRTSPLQKKQIRSANGSGSSFAFSWAYICSEQSLMVFMHLFFPQTSEKKPIILFQD